MNTHHCLFFVFSFGFVCFGGFFPPKSAHVGLRLPDTHIPTATRASLYSIYVYQEKGRRQEEREDGETYFPQIPPKGGLRAKHNGRVCSPTAGSTLLNILLVFLTYLF